MSKENKKSPLQLKRFITPAGYKRMFTPSGGVMLYSETDETTPVARVCLACKGNFESTIENPNGSYSKTICRWCSGGLMDQHSISKYLDYTMKTEEQIKSELNEKSIQDLIERYIKEEGIT